METRAPHLTLLTKCPGPKDTARSELKQVRVKPWVRASWGQDLGGDKVRPEIRAQPGSGIILGIQPGWVPNEC